MKTLILLFCLLPTISFAKTEPAMESAKVLSQDLSSHEGGYAVLPMGSGIVGAPISRMSNIVVIETPTQRITWAEDGRKFIILPVHGTINFYRDGKWFIVMDANKKKHKFGILHLEVKTADPI
jgi:hypothetical protein